MFIDSHTHLYLDQFDDDREQVINRALENKVSKMLLPNIDSSTLEDMVDMFRSFPGICFPMIGLHPGSVNENYEEELQKIFRWVGKYEFVAIGEIGIDLYWDSTYQMEQEKVFKTQISWAKELNLPIVIHSRESFREIFKVLDEEMDSNLNGVFHSFTGGQDEVDKILKYGFYFGINGIVSFKNSGLGDVVKKIPLDKILLETDSPYLAPVPKRGKRNESSFLIYTAEKIAEIFNLKNEEIARITTENANRLFKLS